MSDRPSGASDYDTKIIEEFRGNEGRAGGPWAGAALILIHHIGVRSGTERVSPLATSLKEKAASPSWPPTEDRQPPDRYYNLKAHPRITVEVGTRTFGPGGGAQPRPRRTVAQASRGYSCPQRIPGQDQAADSGGHADPLGLTCDKVAGVATPSSPRRTARLYRN